MPLLTIAIQYSDDHAHLPTTSKSGVALTRIEMNLYVDDVADQMDRITEEMHSSHEHHLMDEHKDLSQNILTFTIVDPISTVEWAQQYVNYHLATHGLASFRSHTTGAAQ